jgi:fatty acid desaturase
LDFRGATAFTFLRAAFAAFLGLLLIAFFTAFLRLMTLVLAFFAIVFFFVAICLSSHHVLNRKSWFPLPMVTTQGDNSLLRQLLL